MAVICQGPTPSATKSCIDKRRAAHEIGEKALRYLSVMAQPPNLFSRLTRSLRVFSRQIDAPCLYEVIHVERCRGKGSEEEKRKHEGKTNRKENPHFGGVQGPERMKRMKKM